MKIIVGTPVHREGAFVLDKFMANQKLIQQHYPSSKLVFATDDIRFAEELNKLIKDSNLKANVISYQVVKPDYAKSRLWRIAAARESIRKYFLSQPGVDSLLFLDADMTFDPKVITIMQKEMKNYDAVFSGYRFRNDMIGLTGAGCLFLGRSALEKIQFRCYEFKNGQDINEDSVAEMDLFKQRCRIKKGFFVAIDHYASPTEAKHIDPQKVGVFKKVVNNNLVRYCLIKTSVVLHYNIPNKSQRILWHFQRAFEKAHRNRLESSQCL
jgi:hypothetical protein